MTAKVLAVVPARGGSQNVPKKNIATVLGRPALAYTLDHIRAAKLVSRAVVSTEDAEIAAVARGLGADVVDRPAEFSAADARLDHVLRHAVEMIGSKYDWRPEMIVMLYGAVPIRPDGFIDRCIEMLMQRGADSVRSVAHAREHHPLWSVELDKRDRIHPFAGKANIYRRQDLPAVYFYTGACVALRTDCLMKALADSSDNFGYLGRDQVGARHDPEECVEIHDPIDIEWAEFLLQRRQRRE